MTQPPTEAESLLKEAIERAAAAVRRVSAVMISDHESITLATAALLEAEPLLRQHIVMQFADKAEATGPAGAAAARVMRQAVEALR